MPMKPEAGFQVAVFEWATLMQGRWPELRFMYHCPNGGSRNKIEAIHLKAQGVKAGVPDIFLPSARHSYHGLYIEMKAGKNKPTAAQLEYLEYLTEAGYLCEVCYNSIEAINTIKEYLTAWRGDHLHE